MGLGVGIVGLPNVGKSTTFNALTKAQNAESANYPFCTIEPNKAVVPVQDPRLEELAKIVNPERIQHSTVDFVDIAGLVKGASAGEGLGNQFLSNIREVEVILHMVRCFEDENITHVENSINPLRDIEIIESALIFADVQPDHPIAQEEIFGPVLAVIKASDIDEECAEAQQIAKELSKVQFDHIQSRLGMYSITTAKISGIGGSLCKRLALQGITTAADILDVVIDTTRSGRYTNQKAYIKMRNGSLVHVEGIGASKAESLIEWRRRLEIQARHGMPINLPIQQAQNISATFRGKVALLEIKEQEIKSNGENLKYAIRTKYKKLQDGIVVAERSKKTYFIQTKNRISKELAEKNGVLQQHERAVKKSQRESLPYSKLSFENYLKNVCFIKN